MVSGPDFLLLVLDAQLLLQSATDVQPNIGQFTLKKTIQGASVAHSRYLHLTQTAVDATLSVGGEFLVCMKLVTCDQGVCCPDCFTNLA